MDAKSRDSIRRALLRKQADLLSEVAQNEADLALVEQTHESELEEQAQLDLTKHLLARLDDRANVEVAEIRAALARLGTGTFGRCETCGKAIPVRRLRAKPTARTCVDCAALREAIEPDELTPAGAPHAGPSELRRIPGR